MTGESDSQRVLGLLQPHTQDRTKLGTPSATAHLHVAAKSLHRTCVPTSARSPTHRRRYGNLEIWTYIFGTGLASRLRRLLNCVRFNDNGASTSIGTALPSSTILGVRSSSSFSIRIAAVKPKRSRPGHRQHPNPPTRLHGVRLHWPRNASQLSSATSTSSFRPAVAPETSATCSADKEENLTRRRVVDLGGATLTHSLGLRLRLGLPTRLASGNVLSQPVTLGRPR
jgi:hypothetical protein